MNDIVYVGVDVSKKELVVKVENSRGYKVVNTPKNIVKFLDRLQNEHKSENLHVCYESTGVYGDLIRECCLDAGIAVSILNPKKVRDWAKGIGAYAKTDKIDAKVICDYSRATAPKRSSKLEQWRKDISALLRFRKVLKDQKVMFEGQIEQTLDKRLVRRFAKEKTQLERKIKKIEKEISEEIQKHEDLRELIDRETIVKGIGELTAVTVIVYTPELGTLGRKRSAAITGLAPYADDSGNREGKRCIYGGRSMVREALYMPALSAIQHNQTLKAFYQRLTKSGKKPKVALTAVMRKLIVLMDLIAKDPNFEPANT